MRKLFGFLLLLSVLAGCAYLYALYFFIPEQMKTHFSETLTKAGFEHVKYKSVSVSGGGVIFNGVTLDEKGFASVDRVEIRYSPISYLFRGGQADLVKIHKLRLTGELSDSHALTLAGWQVGDDLTKKLAAFSAHTVLIEESAVDLLSPELGGLKFEFEGQLKQGGGKNGELGFFGRVKSKQRKLGFDSSVTGTLSKNGQLDMTAKADELQIETGDLKLNRSSAEITFIKFPDSSPSIAIRALATSLSWRSMPFGDMNIIIERKDGDLNLFAEGKTQGTEKIDFSVGIKSGQEEATTYEIVASPENFSLLTSYLIRNGLIKEGLPLPPLMANLKSPALSVSFDDAIGTTPEAVGVWSLEAEAQGLSLEGEFAKKADKPDTWGARCTKASFTEEAEEGSLAPPFYTDIPLFCAIEWDSRVKPAQPIWGIRADIRGEELHFGPIQLMKITGQVGERYTGTGKPERRSTLTFELPIRKEIEHQGRIRINLDATGGGLIESINLSVYGGTIRADNFDLKGLSFPPQMTFKVSDINLTDYVKDLKLSNLVVFGHLGGVLPLVRRKGGLMIKDGLLQSQEPGIIRMPESLSYTLFPGPDKQMSTIRAALKNYHYEFFELRLDGTVSGSTMITLNSRGTNPDLQDKKPIEMNLQIETQIGVLVEHMLAGKSQ